MVCIVYLVLHNHFIKDTSRDRDGPSFVVATRD